MLEVVSHDLGSRQGTVTISSPDMEEVAGPAAKTLALDTAAANGISRPGISGHISPYPVDENGETSDELIKGRSPVAGYRVDFPITGGL